MNERVMQFRIGMFVIVAGLVLTMMIVWFGESPALLRDQVYLKVHYAEAPGVLEGVPVRKSGIRIGEVIAIAFDERAGAPDGVLVTLALERRYKLREGTHPRLDRSLIGDVSIDMQPGTGPGLLPTGNTPLDAPVVEGSVAPDPSKALAAATKAFESAGDTLRTIDEAASGLAKLTKSADRVDEFVTTWLTTGKELTNTGRAVSKVADTADKFIKQNEKEVHAAIAYITSIAQKVDETFDEKLQGELKQAAERFSAAADRLNNGIAQIEPALKELGGPFNAKAGHRPGPGRAAAEPDRRRRHALDQQAPRRQGRPEHRRQPPAALDPGRSVRQPQQGCGPGQPGAATDQDRLERDPHLCREGGARPRGDQPGGAATVGAPG